MARQGPGLIDVKIGEYFRQLRLEADLAQEDVASALGVSQQQVNKQEKGTARLSLDQLRRLGAFYGRTLVRLIREIELEKEGVGALSDGEAPTYDAGPAARSYHIDSNRTQEPFLIDIAKIRDPAGRRSVLATASW